MRYQNIAYTCISESRRQSPLCMVSDMLIFLSRDFVLCLSSKLAAEASSFLELDGVTTFSFARTGAYGAV